MGLLSPSRPAFISQWYRGYRQRWLGEHFSFFQAIAPPMQAHLGGTSTFVVPTMGCSDLQTANSCCRWLDPRSRRRARCSTDWRLGLERDERNRVVFESNSVYYTFLLRVLYPC